MKKVKIVTIGGGSSYTPELMEGLIRRYERLPISEIWLVDIPAGEEKLQIVGALAQRMWEASGYPVTVHTTLDRREALPGADFVTTQFRVGQLEARIKDERIPCLYGMLGQETNGAGGIFKALRTIPVIGEIISDMRELCPDAWLINFTNPSGIITESAIKHFGWKKTIGLCNIPVISMKNEPLQLGYREEDLVYQFAGLNHFHWHRVWTKDGHEVTNDLITKINEPGGGMPKNIHSAEMPVNVLTESGLMPCGYHRYYYAEEEMLAHAMDDFHKNGTRAEQMKAVEKELFQLYKDPTLIEKPKALEKRGGAFYSDAACTCICAIWNDTGEVMTVSTQNQGALSFLPDDCIVEVSARLTAHGTQPLVWGSMPSAQRGWLQLMKAMEECTIQAALTGSYAALTEAFLLNPLIRNGENSIRLLNELLVAHEKYLPQFSRQIQSLKSQGVHTEDPVVQDLMERGL